MNGLVFVTLFLGAPQDLADLVRKLGSESAQERDESEAALVRAGKEAGKLLMEAKETSPDPEIRARATRILRKLAYQEVLGPGVAREFVQVDPGFPKLQVLIKNRESLGDSVPDKEVGTAIAQDILGCLGSDELKGSVAGQIARHNLRVAAWVLVTLLKEGGRSSRLSAIQALGQLKLRKEEVAPFLKDEDPYARMCAATALAEMGAREYAKDIADLLTQNVVLKEITVVRSAAILALAKLEAKEYVPSISKFLNDDDPSLRAAAILGLGMLRAVEHTKDFLALLKEENPLIQSAAIKALGYLGAKQHVKEIVAFLDREDGLSLAAAVEALGLLGDRDNARRIVSLVHYWYVPVQWAVVEAVRRWGIESIVGFLNDDDPRLRAGALVILGRLTAKDRCASIAERLRDKHPNVRGAAVEALGQLHAYKYEEDLTRLLEDGETLTRAWEQCKYLMGDHPQPPRTVKQCVRQVLDSWKQK